jgi:hypothetical protein
MMRPIYFCRQWATFYKEALDIYTEEEARAADAVGAMYSVLVDSPTHPTCVIENVKETNFIGVIFLDEKLREHLQYYFVRQEDGRLFLTEAKHRDFNGDTDEITGGTDYLFNPEGEVRVTEYENGTTRSGSKKLDVSKNYSPDPKFGEYDEIIRIDR